MAETSVGYKCPSCMAPIAYQPGTDKITCEYCGTEITMEALQAMYAQAEENAAAVDAAREAKWSTESAGNDWDPQELEMMKAYTCSVCGAEIVCDGNTMATECCYCGNPTMLPSRFANNLKPDFIIPFEMTKEQAKEAMKKFYEGKRLLPSNFATQNRIEAVQGMYVPYWLFDSTVAAAATFTATNSRRYTSGNSNITETDHYRCSRMGSMHFARVPVDGSIKMDDTLMESVEPYDYSDMVPFTTAYMAGFLADKYDVDALAAAPRADERVNNTAIDTLREDVTGYDTCSLDEGSEAVNKSNNTVQYAMAPVWILSTKYENKAYTFLMNGQTGKFVGSLPIDWTKANMYTLAAFIPSLIVFYFIAKFFLADWD